MIVLDHVTISFGGAGQEIAAVREVSFDVNSGEAFGLVGESGSGKTTILRAMAGLPAQMTGEIRIDNSPIAVRRTPAMRKKVQMVFQDCFGSLHPNHTVDQILCEPLSIHRLDDREKRIKKVLEEVGLGTRYRFRYPHELSGGQRQRVAIARAVIVEPKILLLDEPTSALDVSVQAEILNLLTRLRDIRGLTIVMVSHDLAVVSHVCPRIGVMNNGELVEVATREQLASGDVAHPYTRNLLESDRAVGGSFVLGSEQPRSTRTASATALQTR